MVCKVASPPWQTVPGATPRAPTSPATTGSTAPAARGSAAPVAPAAPTTRPRSSPPSRSDRGADARRATPSRPRCCPRRAAAAAARVVDRARAPGGPTRRPRRPARAAAAPSVPRSPPPAGPSRGRRRPKLGWLKYVLIVWLVFLIAVPADRVVQDREGRRVAERCPARVAARDDVPPGRQRQPQGPDPQAAARVRRRQGRGPPHRHDHAAAHRVRAQHADVDPAGLDRRRAGARHHQDQRRLRPRRPQAAGQDHRAEHRHPGRRLHRDRLLGVHRRGGRRRAAWRSAPSRR